LKILVTGAAGFIGFHLSLKLSNSGHTVIGLDNINDYYDINLKYLRLKQAGIEKEKIDYNKKTESIITPNYEFIKLDLKDKDNLFLLFKSEKFDCICNMAAQAGVRYSLENPYTYVENNINGFINILEACRNYNIKHLIYASSSSVYGMNKKTPFSVEDKTDNPVSLYAATKKSNELMAFTYAHLYNIPCTGLRFFTVYGPWGRPDMAYFKFANFISENKPIDVYNHGNMLRDFTYIDDITNGISASLENIPDTGNTPFVVYNLGNNKPVKLNEFINILEKYLGRKANKNYLDMQPGDVPATMADIDFTYKNLVWKPSTSIEDGLKLFVDWYNVYKKL